MKIKHAALFSITRYTLPFLQSSILFPPPPPKRDPPPLSFLVLYIYTYIVYMIYIIILRAVNRIYIYKHRHRHDIQHTYEINMMYTALPEDEHSQHSQNTALPEHERLWG
jgi:hypothetical protein